MSTTSFIDPFQIATMGIASNNPLTIATQGFIFYIEEHVEPVPPTPPTPIDVRSGLSGNFSTTKLRKRKKITVYCYIGDERVEQTAYTDDLELSLEDVTVEVSEVINNKPTIVIILPGGKNGTTTRG